MRVTFSQKPEYSRVPDFIPVFFGRNAVMKEISDYYGLLFCCPMNSETKSCAFREIRNKDINERIQYMKLLSKDERSALIIKHKNCLSLRENKVPFSRIAIF